MNTQNSTPAGTATATGTVATVTAKVSQEIVDAVNALETARSVVETSYVKIGTVGIQQAQKQGLTDRAQVSEMLRLSIYSAFGVHAKRDSETEKEFEARQVEVADRWKSDISHLTTFIMPKGNGKDWTPKQAAEARDKALAFNIETAKENKKQGKKGRPNDYIGQKSLMEIIRGEANLENVIAKKTGQPLPFPELDKPKGGKPASAASVGGNASATPSANDPEKQTGDVPTPEKAEETSQPTTLEPGKNAPNARELFRGGIKHLLFNYTNTIGVPLEALEAIIAEEIAALKGK